MVLEEKEGESFVEASLLQRENDLQDSAKTFEQVAKLASGNLLRDSTDKQFTGVALVD